MKVGVYGIARAGGLGGGHAYERNVRVCQILKIGHEGYSKENRQNVTIFYFLRELKVFVT